MRMSPTSATTANALPATAGGNRRRAYARNGLRPQPRPLDRSNLLRRTGSRRSPRRWRDRRSALSRKQRSERAARDYSRTRCHQPRRRGRSGAGSRASSRQRLRLDGRRFFMRLPQRFRIRRPTLRPPRPFFSPMRLFGLEYRLINLGVSSGWFRPRLSRDLRSNFRGFGMLVFGMGQVEGLYRPLARPRRLPQSPTGSSFRRRDPVDAVSSRLSRRADGVSRPVCRDGDVCGHLLVQPLESRRFDAATPIRVA